MAKSIVTITGYDCYNNDGIDFTKLVETGVWLAARLGRETGSKAGRAYDP